MKLVEALNAAFPTLSQRLHAVALLDKDLGIEAATNTTKFLPVSMIENFVLDPVVIWEAIEPVVEKTPFQTIEDVEAAIDSVVDSLTSREIERRAKADLGYCAFRPESPMDTLNNQVQEHIARVADRFSPERVAAAMEHGRAAVAELEGNKRRREHFHGKNVINAFYAKHLHATGMKKEIFKFLGAKKARDRKAVTTFFDAFFAELRSIEGV